MVNSEEWVVIQVLRAVVFFFQAEDGIRDYKVTGVQTCALPIYALSRSGRVDTTGTACIQGLLPQVVRQALTFDKAAFLHTTRCGPSTMKLRWRGWPSLGGLIRDVLHQVRRVAPCKRSDVPVATANWQWEFSSN